MAGVKVRKVGRHTVVLSARSLPLFNSTKWYVGKNGYVYSHDNRLLHRVLTNAMKGQIVDHINGDPLDNRLKNLRFATNTENVRHRHHNAKHNTSGFPGVSYTFARGKNGQKYELKKPWFAKITVNRRQIHLGRFQYIEEAATAYKTATRYFFGKFAPKNFPSVYTRIPSVARATLSELKSCYPS